MVSKHYYMGSQRVATSVTDLASQLSSTGSGSEFGGPANQSNASDPVIQDFEATMTCLYGNQVSFGFDSDLDLPLMDEVAFVDCNEGVVVDPNQIVAENPECACEQSTYWASQYEADCPSYNIMYWYHPDYLGSVEAVTDIDGEVYQFFHNTIWGEDIVSQKSYLYNHYSSPYRFNGKEKDWETGNYYYGARYYDPKISAWIGVDLMSSRDPGLTPYHFVKNNPVMFVDPNGMTWDPATLKEAVVILGSLEARVCGIEAEIETLKSEIEEKKVSTAWYWSFLSKEKSIKKRREKITRLNEMKDEVNKSIDDWWDINDDETVYSFANGVGESYKDKGNVFMAGRTDAEKVHEMKHGAQNARGAIILNGKGQEPFFGHIGPVEMEVQAYRAQYSYRPGSMPTSMIPMSSLGSIDGFGVGSIYEGVNDDGTPKYLYPVIRSILGMR